MSGKDKLRHAREFVKAINEHPWPTYVSTGKPSVRAAMIEDMNTFYVLTSLLGYEGRIDKVTTEASLKDLKSIDSKYGMKYRHESTTIDQLKEGAEQEGFVFSYENVIPMTPEWDKLRVYQWDYAANWGNY